MGAAHEGTSAFTCHHTKMLEWPTVGCMGAHMRRELPMVLVCGRLSCLIGLSAASVLCFACIPSHAIRTVRTLRARVRSLTCFALKQGGSGATSSAASPPPSPTPFLVAEGGAAARHLSPLVKQRREQLAWQVRTRNFASVRASASKNFNIPSIDPERSVLAKFYMHLHIRKPQTNCLLDQRATASGGIM